jgi:putative endonuclease
LKLESYIRADLKLERLHPSSLLRARFIEMLRLKIPHRLLEKARTRFAHADEPELAPHLELGRRGERLAAAYLSANGYKLVASNFKLGVGRNRRGAVVQAEIDLVAYEGPTLCFVEVKTRASDWFAAPEANVDLRKQRQVTRAARAYRRALGLRSSPFRYDVVSVVLPPPAEDGSTHAPRLELLRNFWTEDKFRKRRWSHNP